MHGTVFNAKGYEIAPNSGLTANIVEGNNKLRQLKVFFLGKDGTLDVAYNMLNNNQGESWSNRDNITE